MRHLAKKCEYVYIHTYISVYLLNSHYARCFTTHDSSSLSWYDKSAPNWHGFISYLPMSPVRPYYLVYSPYPPALMGSNGSTRMGKISGTLTEKYDNETYSWSIQRQWYKLNPQMLQENGLHFADYVWFDLLGITICSKGPIYNQSVVVYVTVCHRIGAKPWPD